jgi:hypothetical protein
MTTMPAEIGDSRKTQELLWKQIKEQGHLPGFSNVVDQIVGAMQSENEREFSMTRTVLSDPALTHRVLRLANSAMYAMFGEINTVSRAVMVLGTESIGHLALGLKLVDSLATVSSNSAGVRTEMEKAVLAGHRTPGHRPGQHARCRRGRGLLAAARAGPHGGGVLPAEVLGRDSAAGAGGQ